MLASQKRFHATSIPIPNCLAYCLVHWAGVPAATKPVSVDSIESR
jgi:hypothetical protein